MAAFCAYFCMYAFRKPFTAGTFNGQEFAGLGLKTVLVLSQLCGYMLSKFIGIKVIAEMPKARRAMAMIGLMAFAELALVGFALLPLSGKVVMMFLNGLPLGMVFGLVLSYLEGRKHTDRCIWLTTTTNMPCWRNSAAAELTIVDCCPLLKHSPLHPS